MSSSAVPAPAPAAVTIARNTTARGQAELRRQYENDVAREALTLAKTSIDSAMDFLQEKMPKRFLEHSVWYLSTFKYVSFRVQRARDEQRHNHREHTWPDSFPD
ncbi:unnamed protein product, partial [Adineta ricciae]